MIKSLFSLVVLLTISCSIYAQSGYLKHKDMVVKLRDISSRSSNLSVETLTETGSGRDMVIFSAISDPSNPAIFVAANMSGITPINSEGALYLADLLSKNAETYSEYSWYILPTGNPDAYSDDLTKIGSPFNYTRINNDLDEDEDEDGSEDINKDGIISVMRILDPVGDYKLGSDGSIVKAEKLTPASDRYSIYSEGIDNDGDGKINEDPKGGVDISQTFTYNYNYLKKESGLWPGKESETLSIFEFFASHPEICATVTLGESDFLRESFVSKPKAEKSYSLSGRYARMLGVKSGTRLKPSEVAALANSKFGGGYDEVSVLSFLIKDPLTSPLEQDYNAYQVLRKSYESFIDDTTKLVKSTKPLDGSFETWSYYHRGLPSIAMRLWDIPQYDKKDSRDQSYLKYNDKQLSGEGFLEWSSFDHPTLGEVEIGGPVKGYQLNPQAKDIEDVVSSQIPWLLKLPTMLPTVVIKDVDVKSLGGSIYKMEVTILNDGDMPTELAMGSLSNKPAPVVMVLEGDIKMLDGKLRTLISPIAGKHAKKLSFIIETESRELDITFDAKCVKSKNQTVKLK